VLPGRLHHEGSQIQEDAMAKALFVGIEARESSREDVANFLRHAVEAAEREPGTRDWYALRFDDRRFAIFDTFTDHVGRLRHLVGEIGRGLLVRSMSSLQGLPDIETSELVAAKLPAEGAAPRVATYVPIETKLGEGRDFGEFLVRAREIAMSEPGTLAWYAVRANRNHFAVLALFTDEAARDAHMNGEIAGHLKEHGPEVMVHLPEIVFADVLASKRSDAGLLSLTDQAKHSELASRIGPADARPPAGA